MQAHLEKLAFEDQREDDLQFGKWQSYFDSHRKAFDSKPFKPNESTRTDRQLTLQVIRGQFPKQEDQRPVTMRGDRFFTPLKISFAMQARVCTYDPGAMQKVVQQSLKKDYLDQLCHAKGFPMIKLNKPKINNDGYPQLPHIKRDGTWIRAQNVIDGKLKFNRILYNDLEL